MILTIEIKDTVNAELNADYATRPNRFTGEVQTVESKIKSYVEDEYAALQRRNLEKAISAAQIPTRATVDMDAARKAKIAAAIEAAEKLPAPK